MTRRCLCVLFLAACSTDVRGTVQIEPQKNKSGGVEALDIVFTKEKDAKGDLAMTRLFARVQTERSDDAGPDAGPTVILESVAGIPDCTRVPQSGRLSVLVDEAAIGKGTRVHVTVHRDSCVGEPLSDAVWWSERTVPPADTDASVKD